MKSKWGKTLLIGGVIVAIIISIGIAVAMTAIAYKGRIDVETYTATLSNKTYWIVLAVIYASLLTWFYAEMRINADKDVVKDNQGEESRWLTKTDIRKSKDFVVTDWKSLDKVNDGVVLQAKKNGRNIDVILSAKPNHVLVIGTTGAGKTQGFINPTVQVLMNTKTKPSMVITDPKGELYNTHAAAFVEKGYRVLVLDLDAPYYSSKWNPFDVIRERIDKINELSLQAATEEVKVKVQILRDEIYEFAKDLTDAICPLEKSNDMGWQLGARSLINAIVLAYCEDYEEGLLESKQLGFASLYHTVFDYLSADDETLKQYLYESRDPNSKVKGLAKQVLETQERTLTSYLSEVYKHVEWLSDSGILSMTSGSDIDLYAMDDEPTALFIKIPDEKKTRHRLVTLLITQMYKTLVDKTKRNYASGETDELELKRTVYFLLDEFGNLPAFADLSGMVTVGRSRKMFFEMVVQNYAQLANKYGKEVADTVKSQCATKIFLGSDDTTTINEYSALCGKKIVANSSLTTSYDRNTVSTGTGVKEVPLIYPQELKNLNSGDDFGNAIVLPFGHFAYKSKYTPSFQCKDIYVMKKPPASIITPRYFNESEHVYDITSKLARDQEIMAEMADTLRAIRGEDKKPTPTVMQTPTTSLLVGQLIRELEPTLPELGNWVCMSVDQQLTTIRRLKAQEKNFDVMIKLSTIERELEEGVNGNDK
ncbi:MAG: VirD4-like conjugal transfer protein, CD1115 family [Christensenellales bacterium]